MEDRIEIIYELKQFPLKYWYRTPRIEIYEGTILLKSGDGEEQEIGTLTLMLVSPVAKDSWVRLDHTIRDLKIDYFEELFLVEAKHMIPFLNLHFGDIQSTTILKLNAIQFEEGFACRGYEDDVLRNIEYQFYDKCDIFFLDPNYNFVKYVLTEDLPPPEDFEQIERVEDEENAYLVVTALSLGWDNYNCEHISILAKQYSHRDDPVEALSSDISLN